MKFKNSVLLITTVCCAVLLVYNSCKKDKSQPVVAMPNAIDTCSAITYSKTIAPIITTSCAIGSSCHGTGSSHVAFTNYASVLAEVSNVKLSYTSSPAAILGKTLDMSGSSYAQLSSSQINQFICWLKNGAPNN
jgi:hypothetical protein